MSLSVSSPHLAWLLLAVCWILMGSTPAAGQPNGGTLRVIVTSAEDGRPLPGAHVVLEAVRGGASHAGATDLDGYVQLTEIEPGRYQLAVSFVGFETRRDTLTLQAERRTYAAALPVQEQTLDEVRVEAERGAARRQAGLQTVGAADLERIPTPGATGDLASYLQTLPGVISAGDRGGQLYIRGGTPSQNLILVDGLPIIKPFHISSLYSAFPQDIIRNVDVYAGGFSAEYMGAISSAIDVTLRRGNMQEFAGSASMSPFIASTRIEGPIERGRQSFLIVARRSIIGQTADPLFGREVPLRFHDVTGRYSLQSESATCNLTAMHTGDRGQINADRNTVLSWSNLTVGGRCLAFGQGVEHAYDLSAGYTQFENSAGTQIAPERSARLQKIYFSLDRDQDVWGTLFNVGVRWEVNRYEADLDEKFVTLEGLKQNAAALQAYVLADWTIGDYLTVRPSFGTHVTGERIGQP